MAVQVETLVTTFQAKTSQHNRGVTGVNKVLDKYGNKVTQASSKMQKFSARLNAVGQQAQMVGASMSTAGARIGAAGAAIVGVLGLITKAAIDFEASFTDVTKTVDLSDQGFEVLRGRILNLSRDIPVATDRLNSIATTAGQLGVQGVENITKFTETAARIAFTTNVSSEQAATSFARISAVMNEPISDIDRMASSVVELGNRVETTEGEILEFSNRLSGVGAVVGLTSAEVFGISAAFKGVGAQTEAAGTAAQKVLLTLNQAAAQGGEELEVLTKTMNLSNEQFTNLVRTDPAQAFTRFVESLKDAGDNAVPILEDLNIADQRVIRSFLALSNAGGKLRETIDIANEGFDKNSALVEESEKKFASAEAKLTKLKNAFNLAAISVGRNLLDGLKEFLDVLTPAINGFSDWVDVNRRLATVLAVAAGAIGILTIVGGGLLFVTGQLTIAFGAVAIVISSFTGAAAGATAATLILKAATIGLSASIATAKIAIAAYVGFLVFEYTKSVTGVTEDQRKFNEEMKRSQKLSDELVDKHKQQTASILEQADAVRASEGGDAAISLIERQVEAAQVNLEGQKRNLKGVKEEAEELDTTWNNLWNNKPLEAAQQSVREQTAVIEQQENRVDLLKRKYDELTGAAERSAGRASLVGEENQKLVEDIEKLTSSLEHQVSTFGLSGNELKIYELKLRGATEAELEQARAFSETIEKWERKNSLQERANELTEQFMTPQERLISLQEELNTLRDKGIISQETMNRALADAEEKVDAANPLLQKAKQIQESILTPQERFARKQEEINELVDKGFLSQKEANRALAQAEEGLKTTGAQRTAEFAGAIDVRSSQGFSFLAEAFTKSPQAKAQEMTAKNTDLIAKNTGAMAHALDVKPGNTQPSTQSTPVSSSSAGSEQSQTLGQSLEALNKILSENKRTNDLIRELEPISVESF